MEDNVLYLTRFCGVEQYPVLDASWDIIEGDGTADDPDMLCLEVRFGKGSCIHEDTQALAAEPFWEINFYAIQIPISALQPGFCLEQPNEADDADGNLYYTEHQPVTDNRMEILETKETRLKIRLTGTTEDVNYYDGSKPKNTMQVTAWFERR